MRGAPKPRPRAPLRHHGTGRDHDGRRACANARTTRPRRPAPSPSQTEPDPMDHAGRLAGRAPGIAVAAGNRPAASRGNTRAAAAGLGGHGVRGRHPRPTANAEPGARAAQGPANQHNAAAANGSRDPAAPA
jgi:hypothetical protein